MADTTDASTLPPPPVETVSSSDPTGVTQNVQIQIFSSILLVLSLYLSIRVNRGFSIGSFLFALCCPFFQVPQVLGTKGPSILWRNSVNSTPISRTNYARNNNYKRNTGI